MTQGDPLSMHLYSLDLLPLVINIDDYLNTINRNNKRKNIQIWYADDSSFSGNISDIKLWLNYLIEKGPGCVYNPNVHKRNLVIPNININKIKNSKELSSYMGIKNIVHGHKYLGSYIGCIEEEQRLFPMLSTDGHN